MRRERTFLLGRSTLVLGALLLAESLPGADQQHPPPANPAAARVWKTEIKLLVTAENTVQAIRVLKLDEHQAVKETVCYFDTSDGALAAKHLILRARQNAGQPGESTVKLLATAGATDLSDAERSIQPEQDWTNESEPTFARSVDRKSLASGLVSKVAAGQAAVDELFNTAQRKLVAARMKEFNWESLRCYGPVEAQVWRQQWKLYGFPKEVTVELWQLRQDGRTQDILEVSAKARPETEAQAQALAQQFFAAAKTAGLGEPAGQSKTQKVMDFFRPGR